MPNELLSINRDILQQTINLSMENTEIELKDKTIKTQGKEIKKQKRLKIMGFIGTIVLPIITLIALI